MSRVFVTHEPSYWDRQRKKMVALDVSPADRFGQRVVIFPGLDRPPRGDAAVEPMARALANYTPDDYLLVSGNPDLLVWAAVLAFRRAGTLRLLKWNNRDRDYEVVPAPDSLCA